MKRLIFCLIAFTTLMVASARDVGVQLQTDIGITYTIPTVQHSDFIPFVAVVTLETTQVVQVQPTDLSVINQKVTQLNAPPVYCNPDYGSYAQVSVSNPIITQNMYNTKAYNFNRNCTARHV